MLCGTGLLGLGEYILEKCRAQALQSRLALAIYCGDHSQLVFDIYHGVDNKSDLGLEEFVRPSGVKRTGRPGRPPSDPLWARVVLARFWCLRQKEEAQPRDQRRDLKDIAEQASSDVISWFGRENVPSWSVGRIFNLASEQGGKALASVLGVPPRSKSAKLQAALADALQRYSGQVV